ncbi:MAG: phosphoglycolate phosphatase [Pirellulaceae bacterium]|nr:MAG: phosphoglycolate phosphatase [Pirellulaceae bacterium]
MKVVFFDIDGTLLLSGGAGRQALESGFCHCFGVSLVKPIVLDGRPDRAVGTALFEAHGLQDTEENWARLCRAYLHRLPATLKQRPGRVLPGVLRLLDLLARRPDVFLGLLTGNVREGARIKLEHFSLLPFFGPPLIGGFGDQERDRRQVAKRAVVAVERHLGLEGARAEYWVVGDTPWDVQAARAIGARCVAVATGFYSLEQLAAYKPDFLLSDLEQLDDLPHWWRELSD